jgi:hypothetical protein
MEDQLSSIVMLGGACLVTVLLLAWSVCESGDADEEEEER